MTTPVNKAKNIGLQVGLIAGVLLGLVSIVGYMTDTFGESYYSLLNWGVIIGGMVYVSRQLREQLGGFMTLGQGFRVNFTMGVIAYTVNATLSTIYTQFIDTEAIARFMERTRIDMLSNPDMPEEGVDMALNMIEKMSEPYIAVPLAIVGGAFTAALLGVAVAAILKKDPPPGWRSE